MEPISIQDYVKDYFNGDSIPGEHHFVAVYLLSKFDKIPDYLNPDGMKNSLPGDIGFKKSDKTFSVEVKLGKKNNKSSISFTASQYEKWFVKSDNIPNYLIVLIKDSFFIIDFVSFVSKYKKNNIDKINKFTNKKKKQKNGPSLNKECLKDCCKESEVFDLNDEDIISKRFQYLNKEINEL